MTTRILFRTFLICLVCCASMVLTAIWLQDKITNPLYFQCTATFFVIGLTSFLVWFSLLFRALCKKS